MQYISVLLGGAIGSLLRYIISLQLGKYEFPVATFLVNCIGSFLIGCIAGIVEGNQSASPDLVLFCKVGFCGGFTTFSTFSLETWQFLDQKAYGTAGLYVVLSIVSCLAGVWTGRKIGLVFS